MMVTLEDEASTFIILFFVYASSCNLGIRIHKQHVIVCFFCAEELIENKAYFNFVICITPADDEGRILLNN